MKKIGFAILVFLLVVLIFLSQLKLSNHPVLDNDEGIYLTSFLLINKGHPPYRETFFSQPPGFLLAVYPGFVLFGKTLPAARLTVGLWSFIGLLGIIWIGFELGNRWIGILTIVILYLSRYYINQTLTFQSDIIVVTFTLLSLGSLLHYLKSSKLTWFISAVFFLNLAFWTKFDITFIPAFLFILFFLNKSSKTLRTLLIKIFFSVSVIFFLIFILPFGFKEVFQNTILFRFQSVNQSLGFWLLIDYLKKDPVLLLVITGTFLLGFVFHKNVKLTGSVIVIGFLSFLFFFFYRPLFLHHLAILSVPSVLAFTYLFYLAVKSKKYLFPGVVIVILTISVYKHINTVYVTPSQILNREQQKAVEVILKNTGPNDLVVSDEEILNGMSGRLPPPELSDISNVRINSNNLSANKFANLISGYKPKLIISWNGRLRSIKSFNLVLKNYKKLVSFRPSQEIYIIK